MLDETLATTSESALSYSNLSKGGVLVSTIALCAAYLYGTSKASSFVGEQLARLFRVLRS